MASSPMAPLEAGMMRKLWEVLGVKFYWANPEHFTEPGVKVWPGKRLAAWRERHGKRGHIDLLRLPVARTVAGKVGGVKIKQMPKPGDRMIFHMPEDGREYERWIKDGEEVQVVDVATTTRRGPTRAGYARVIPTQPLTYYSLRWDDPDALNSARRPDRPTLEVRLDTLDAT